MASPDPLNDIVLVGTALVELPHEAVCRHASPQRSCTCARGEVMKAWGRIVKHMRQV